MEIFFSNNYPLWWKTNFRKADIFEGSNVYKEPLTKLRFTADVALITEQKKTQTNKRKDIEASPTLPQSQTVKF